MTKFFDAEAVADDLSERLLEIQSSPDYRVPVLVQALSDCYALTQPMAAIQNRFRELLSRQLKPAFEGSLVGENGAELIATVQPFVNIEPRNRPAIKEVLMRRGLGRCLSTIPVRIAEAIRADARLADELALLLQPTTVHRFKRLDWGQWRPPWGKEEEAEGTS